MKQIDIKQIKPLFLFMTTSLVWIDGYPRFDDGDLDNESLIRNTYAEVNE
jgi:hypothetical protein